MSERDPMLDVFIFESQQLLETLEEVLLEGDKEHSLNSEQINEVFRIMHTIKGSASMMSFDSLSHLAHAVEDLFAQIRDDNGECSNWDDVFDLVLTAQDNLKSDINKIQTGAPADGEFTQLINKIHSLIRGKGVPAPSASPAAPAASDAPAAFDSIEIDDPNAAFYKIKIFFEPDCQMENMRAFGVVTPLQEQCYKMVTIPADLMAEGSAAEIVANGFILYVQSSANPDLLKKIVDSVMFLQSSSLIPVEADSEELPASIRPKKPEPEPEAKAVSGGNAPAKQSAPAAETTAKQNFISVNVNKLDKLMDLVGEIVTTESMVTKNPEILNLQIEGFDRNAQQLRKLINELQDTVMSIRMIPVSATFQKMHRIVRDMSKKIQKEVDLVIIGEETEVDKNIIDTISDPLMHLIRNAVDHGLEPAAERATKGKSTTGKVTLEARNSGGDVMILVQDDGQGLDRNGIIKKALSRGLTTKTEAEISDKEAFGMIFIPGFSTNETVTEFSGRGVGMDVVKRNIDKVGGSISVESAKDVGTTVMIRIPLTLAIIEGMKLRVGKLNFIVPMLSIQESFKPNMADVFLDPDGSEMIMIRGEVFPIMRLHRLLNIEPEIQNLEEGILIMITTDVNTYCLFVDQLIGEQQAVIKPLPAYIQKHNIGMHGIGGCTILGDGSISLIIDINSLVL